VEGRILLENLSGVFKIDGKTPRLPAPPPQSLSVLLNIIQKFTTS